MGHRANLILVRASGYELFYSHWGAKSLVRDLFWGPAAAQTFIGQQRRTEEGAEWLDEVWAEGAALLHRDARVLLFYGGEELLYDIPLRRLYLQLMGNLWSGWSLRWAFRGIGDLCEYVGEPLERVLVEGLGRGCQYEAPEQLEWSTGVASMVDVSGELSVYALAAPVEELLMTGEALIESFRTVDSLEKLEFDPDWDFPTGGLHIDCQKRQLGFWLAEDFPIAHKRLAEVWPQWQVVVWGDRYEQQEALSGARIRFPVLDREVLVARLRELLIPARCPNPVRSIVNLAGTMGGENLELNPYALRHDPLEMSRERCEILFEEALSGLGDNLSGD